MSILQGEEHLGLPVLNVDEYEMVHDYLESDHVEGILTVENLFEVVEFKRPNIRRLIEFSKSEYMGDEEEGPTVEGIEICDGIESGYEFIVGCLTYTYFLRSGSLTLEDFIGNLPKATHVLPLRKNSQLYRTMRFLSGAAIFDLAHHELIDDSSELATLDTGDYLFNVPHMDALIDAEKDLLVKTMSDEGEHIQGFEIGVESAVEMYIQSREQQILNRLRPQLVKNS